MAKSAAWFVLWIMNIVLVATPARAATKVFLLGGQSNMSGNGNVADLVGPLAQYSQGAPNVNYWNGAQWVSPAYNVLGGPNFGPDLSFGYQMHQHYPNDSIYLIKWAWGGTNLYSDWSPANGGGWCYNNFKSIALTALQTLKDANLSPSIAGMLWMQGEADANDNTMAPAYQTNLVNFIRQQRSDFSSYGGANMQFVIGRIIPDWGIPQDNALVRAAQEAVPGGVGVGPASWINTDDLQQSTTLAPHYGTQGEIDLGLRFAAQFAPVPEPGTTSMAIGAILGTGLLRFAMRRRSTNGGRCQAVAGETENV